MPDITVYPLQWPEGWSRTGSYQRTWGRFRTEPEPAQELIKNELATLGAKDIVISSNMPVKSDGSFDREQWNIDFEADSDEVWQVDPGVAVYFVYQYRQRVIACDRWEFWLPNMQAIGRTVQAIRSIERWGTSEMLTRVHDSFKVV